MLELLVIEPSLDSRGVAPLAARLGRGANGARALSAIERTQRPRHARSMLPGALASVFVRSFVLVKRVNLGYT
jgi:hypothetical protein